MASLLYEFLFKLWNSSDSLTPLLLNNAHKFDKPPSVSVQRAESARVPQLLISQPSFDLRRTQSESHLDAKVIDAVLSSSADFGMENSVEDEIKMLLVGDLNRNASAGMDPQLLGVAPKKDDKDKTLTQADAAKGLALLASQTGSVASLASMNSNRTDNTGTEDGCGGDDEEAHHQLLERKPSTRKAKIQATFAAGKKKVLDLMPQKRKLTDASPVDFNGESIEIGADAGSMYDTDREPSVGRSPMAAVGKRKESPSEDKKEKKRLKKKLSESPKARRSGASQQKDQSPMTTIKARTTKCVQFQKDVMWGQSLHFELDASAEHTTRTTIRYLNVTVHAREVRPAGSPNTSASSIPSVTPSTPDSLASSSTNTENSAAPEPPKPILLGSVSLFVPQLIDDCRLTLSNCHREVFQLKQPNCTVTPPVAAANEDPIFTEFSRHAGFDPRLCFGDITLGFRYFPDGFPSNKAINSGDDSEDECHRVEATSPGRPFSPPAFAPATHEWKVWMCKNATTCAMCRGKIWFRTASQCSRCLVICHSKCVDKANNGGIACSPRQIPSPTNLPLPDDSRFEEISASEVEAANTPDHEIERNALLMQSPSTSSMASSMTSPAPSGSLDTPETSKRAKFRKVTEKFAYWRKGGKKTEGTPGRRDTTDTDPDAAEADRDSPMASIQDVLSDVLPGLDGSPFISGLYFQPGNAYNEQTIRNAKRLGREIFNELPPEERVKKINLQIDRIQTAIRETKDDRLSVMQNDGVPESSSKFQGLDERLQALAVLMLHYCSALQDCQSGRNTPNPPEEPQMSDDHPDRHPDHPDHLQNEEEDDDEESVVDEDTVVADVPDVVEAI
ncbi:hypothetical protein L3Y34_003501 [Caenorhabditis briggsae]|uniref:Phorbol-ester/DAG-type domain-containing protein n=1 Tax=Caenorhabditis briggsae TaxID=6238 RepID=A0AAE9D5X3_CAEBR|nr:hypothetical protein L3Y34_003501 [Caenorhabditis briggsae]